MMKKLLKKMIEEKCKHAKRYEKKGDVTLFIAKKAEGYGIFEFVDELGILTDDEKKDILNMLENVKWRD